ncbi:MAG: asparagine synthase (glutamine-hydrolyzing), partial [Candidatus Binatia bacterium]
MCGIAGKLNLDPAEPVAAETVRAMCAALRHRGPDDDGFLFDGPVGMGMRRLSIIDLSTGRQPIRNEDGSVWVVYNGEIYNFPELRRSLEAAGHRFYTATDTEVIVHLYEEHGEDFVERLAGMFAIALWDRRERKLILARDRLGIKPLYYHLDGRRLLFGSEIKAILEDDVDRDLDLQALHDYLSLNYVPGPRSIFRSIRKLPPAHLLVCAAGRVRLRRYWELRCSTENAGRPVESLCEELHDLLEDTVRGHLLSDVPVGVFLSGGLDSGSLVALASRVTNGPVRTFSIGFDDPSYDELAEARAVVRKFGTDHHEMIVRPDAVTLLPALVRAFDEPFADSSAIPVYCVSRLAREHVKVVLSGEGGDEVFGGYETYAAYKIAALYRRLPSLLATQLIPFLVRQLPVSHRRVSFDYKAKRFVEKALLPPVDGHFGWKVIFSEDAKAALYAGGPNGFESPIGAWREAYARCGSPEPLTRLQHVDLEIYLPDDILVKADRMSMASSLEARVPYLDHRVVEFAASLPASLKVHGLTKKYLLRRTMAPHLPKRIVNGRKRGFN